MTDQGDHERLAHIIYDPDGNNAAALITEARVMGTPLKALCGKVWVPAHDPERFPICPECRELADHIVG